MKKLIINSFICLFILSRKWRIDRSSGEMKMKTVQLSPDSDLIKLLNQN